MLDQYVEGEFDEETNQSLTAHLANCKSCAGARAALLREQKIYASYLLDVEPPSDLWQRLRLKLENEKAIGISQPPVRIQHWLAMAFRSMHVTPQLAAALVLITIGLVIGIVVWRTTIDNSGHQAQKPAVVGVQPSSGVNRAATKRDSDGSDRRSSADGNDRKIRPPSSESNDTHVSAAVRAARHKIRTSPGVLAVDQVALKVEHLYLSAIEILSRDIRRRRAVISPALLSQLKPVLAEVDRNIAATRRAAHAQPRDPVAVQYLALAYEKKIELLREVISW